MLTKIESTWTYNHKHLLVTLSLVAAVVWQSGIVQSYLPQPEVLAYTAEPIRGTIEAEVEQRARDMYAEHEAMDLEKYRQIVLQEYSNELIEIIETSPFVNFDELDAKYGY
jgi:hypothetical protein